MTINEALKAYISRRGFKQQAIADALGMKVQTFNAVLNGHCRLSADVFVKACNYMGVSPDAVLGVQ